VYIGEAFLFLTTPITAKGNLGVATQVCSLHQEMLTEGKAQYS